MPALILERNNSAFPVIDKGRRHPVRPHYIDTSSQPSRLLGSEGLESQALRLIRFFQAKGHWCAFHFEEFLEIDPHKDGMIPAFLGTGEYPLVVMLEDGRYAATHYLITTMFLERPMRGFVPE